jgi:hypothetical protein
MTATVSTGSNPCAYSWGYDTISDIISRTEGSTFNYTYDTSHKHAVKQVGSLYYCYDADGNMWGHNATNSTCTSGGDTRL